VARRGRRSKYEVEQEVVERRCLRCRVEFMANGRFQRLCDECRPVVGVRDANESWSSYRVSRHGNPYY